MSDPFNKKTTKENFDLKEIDTTNSNQEDLTPEARRANLRIITGGSSGTDDPNWLNGLAEGTIFLIEKKNTNDFNCGLFQLARKAGRAAQLFMFSPDGEGITIWVNMVRFCNVHSLVHVLSVINSDYLQEKEEETTEEENG